MADYRSIGVPECWLSSFPSRSVEVLRLRLAADGIGDILRSVLPGFEPIADIFGPVIRSIKPMNLYKLPYATLRSTFVARMFCLSTFGRGVY